jgi:NAD+ kinase
VVFEVLDHELRRVRAGADFSEVRDVVKVTVEVNGTIGPQILFDPEHNLEERIIKEQFVP